MHEGLLLGIVLTFPKLKKDIRGNRIAAICATITKVTVS